jgi:hypothetical protein
VQDRAVEAPKVSPRNELKWISAHGIFSVGNLRPSGNWYVCRP